MSLLAIAGGMFLNSPAGLALGQSCPAITDPQPLNTNAASDSGYDFLPRVTTDAQGNWVAVWVSGDNLGGTIGTDGDILLSRSTDYGVSWTDPEPLNSNAATDDAYDAFPQLTTDGQGNWIAVWQSPENLGGTIGTDRDILFSRSTDNGTTWTDAAPLNTNAPFDSGEDWFPQLTTDGLGNWVALWPSDDDLGGTIGVDSDILLSRSTDDGVTWTTPAALNTNAAFDTGWDRAVQLTTDRQGNWVAVWTSNDDLDETIGKDDDILVSRSMDNGATWTAPIPLNSDAASDGRGDFSPQLTTDGHGNWVAVWWFNSGLGWGDILFSRSTDNGATWTALAALTDRGENSYPQLTTDGQGNWVAVWSSYPGGFRTAIGGSDGDILFSRSTDNGATWTPPLPLNTNAATDTRSDEHPQITTDAQGNWVVVWYSYDDLGGTIGNDADILVARFQLSDRNSDDIPTISEWGLIIMTLLLLVGGSIVLTRRARAAS